MVGKDAFPEGNTNTSKAWSTIWKIIALHKDGKNYNLNFAEFLLQYARTYHKILDYSRN
jgi:hypothetical protein